MRGHYNAKRNSFSGVVAAAAMLSTMASAGGTDSTSGLIARAVTAAPPALRKDAGVMDIDMNGKISVLRRGTNDWTCFPHDIGTPTQSPLCFDKNGLDWYMAVMSGKNPDPAKVGLSYMLQGGSTWSNIHGDATKPEPGQKSFVAVPPHVMILSASVATASGYPSGQVNPDTHKPFVMYGGSPSAVVIMPVK